MSNLPKRLGRIAVITDERLSREKQALFTRTINSVRQFAEVVLLAGNTEEAMLLKKLEAEPFQLVLAPWYRYLAWGRVEAFYGLTRTSGPTFAGYFMEPLLPYELGEQVGHLRTILLDLGGPSTPELHLLIRSLLVDRTRSGVLPLLKPNTPVYCESWIAAQGLGHRLDAITQLPEIASSEWAKRAPELRILIPALWSLIYEEGPGKVELQANIIAKTPRAYFQIAVDSNFICLRLCYTLASLTSKDVMQYFWPDSSHPTTPAQLLIRYSDFLRVHHVADAGAIELVLGLTASAPLQSNPASIHTLWIEPLAGQTFSEIPFTQPTPATPYLKHLPLPSLPSVLSLQKASSEEVAAADRARDKFVADVGAELRGLRIQLQEKEELIKELRSGGVGTAPPLPPPDAEGLLEAFQEKYLEARFQIRQFENQIRELMNRKAKPQEIEQLQKQMQSLLTREAQWIQSISKTLDHYRQVKAQNK